LIVSASQPAFYNDLAVTLDTAWNLLEQGARDRHAPFHALSVASVDQAGNPRQRTMILRHVDRELRTLRFHSDQRSPKFEQISNRPAISVSHYSAEHKLELRLFGKGRFHLGDDIAARAWLSMRDLSRVCYRSPKAPSEPIDSPDDYLDPSKLVVTSDDAIAQRNFCVLIIHVEELDWIYLDHRGNRRARFRWGGNDVASPLPQSQWLQH
jgi:pyridoxamine 5'-phosphate oxidase